MVKLYRIKFRDSSFRLICGVLAWCLLMMGCQTSVTPSAGPDHTALPPTQTPTSPVLVTSHTPTIAPSATWTPLPTLLPTEAAVLVLDLLQNNAGCRLPCWWGLEPGQTTWEAAWQFLATFATRIEQGEARQITENGITYYTTNYSVFYKLPDESQQDRTIYSLKNGIIGAIEVGRRQTVLSYQLHQVLTDYGIPTEVLLRAYASSPEAYLPFRLALFYPQLGILAHYEYEAHKLGDLIQSCPQPTGAELLLWSPQQRTLAFENIELVVLGPDPYITLQPLEDVTDLDVNSFYQIFKNSNNSSCIETPVDLWR